MSFTQFLMRSLTALALVATSLMAPTVHAQSGASHILVSPPQPSGSPGKMEVLAFIFYSCPRCLTMEPLLQSWSKSLPENVVLKRVPVDFLRDYADLQKLYYTLEYMDRMDVHTKVFDAIHIQRKRISTVDAMMDWLATQSVNRAQFESVFHSQPVADKVALAKQLANDYDVIDLPSMAVAGKYLIPYPMSGSVQGMLDETTKLIGRER